MARLTRFLRLSFSLFTSVSLGLMVQKLHKQVTRSPDFTAQYSHWLFIDGNEGTLMARPPPSSTAWPNNFNIALILWCWVSKQKKIVCGSVWLYIQGEGFPPRLKINLFSTSSANILRTQNVHFTTKLSVKNKLQMHLPTRQMGVCLFTGSVHSNW